jgi:ATP-dependent DNA helicase RecG
MDGKDQIIQLGTMLRAELQRDCDDGAADGGLERFLTGWRLEANGALAHEPVRQALELLAGYGMFDLPTRRARVGIAIEGLRNLFRTRDDRPQTTDHGRTAENPEPRTQNPEPRTQNPEPRTQDPEPRTKEGGTALDTKSKIQNPKSKIQSPPKPLEPSSPIEEVPGIGKANAAAFKRLGVKSVYDLLYHFPHRYDDYTSHKNIAEIKIGDVETAVGVVSDVRTFGMKNGRGGVEVLVSDNTGDIKAVFFNQPWIARQFQPGMRIVLSGKVTADARTGQRTIAAPDWQPYTEDELVHAGRLVPVHPLTRGLVERGTRTIIKQVVDAVAPKVEDHLPAVVRERAGLMGLSQALVQMHFPSNKEQLEQARRRLGFDEFLFIQLGVLERKVLWQAERGYPMLFNQEVHEAFLSSFPFELTGAQVRALEEIFEDIRRPVPMARLLQGDVGSGKTAVAAATALQGIANGFQAAIMAPTEILAEQHYRGLKGLLGKVRVPREAAPAEPQDVERQAELDEIKRLLGMSFEDDMEGQGVRVALLTGSLGARERRKVLEGIARGDVDLVVGTHALITESVQYARLGMVIVDEQHRFGVEQRQRLKDKGFNPHMLVMTATPIPRTLTLTIYGDLDTAVLDELPPGRQEIKTRWITSGERDKAYKHLRREISRGRQAFVICPLVEESEKVDLPSAEEMYQKLSSEVFPDLRVALIHGKMLPREKDQIMVAFRNHEYDILVATAVIEVGIDVPNATTILIEGAERFGLAQLHQFRGRVGRGIHQSYCILISDKENEQTKQRLEAMEQTRDGFKLAEIDLQLRGPGEFFGTRQSGTPDLKVAQLADTRLLHAANREAQQILKDDPKLERAEHRLLRAKVDTFWADAMQAG